MKSFAQICLIAFLSLVNCAEVGIDDVRPNVAPVQELVAYYLREEESQIQNKSAARRHPAEFYAVRQQDNCVFPLDIVIVQDATRSFEDDFVVMKGGALRAFMEALTDKHPGSRVSLVSFRDKPLEPFGWTTKPGFVPDYCYSFHQAFTSDLEQIETAYSTMLASGGNDNRESQFTAMVNSVFEPSLPTNPLASKLLAVSTDAPPHHADEPIDKQGMTPYDRSGFLDSSKCLAVFYPSADDIVWALTSRQYYAAFFVYMDSPNMQEYTTLSRLLSQPDEFVKQRDQDSANFGKILSEIILELENAECTPNTTTDATVTSEAVTTTTELTTVPTTVTELTTVPSTTTTSSEDVQVVFLIDNSYSFLDDKPYMQEQIPAVLQYLKEHHDGVVEAAVVTFVDYPLEPYGHPAGKDYCFRVEGDFTSVESEIEEAIHTNVFSGRDVRESQLYAIIGVLQPTGGLQWNADTKRIIVLITDARTHKAGDAAQLGPFTGSATNTLCGKQDYPSLEDVEATLTQYNASLVVLTADGKQSYWQDIVTNIGQNPDRVYTIDESSRDLKVKGIRAITDVLNEKHL